MLLATTILPKNVSNESTNEYNKSQVHIRRQYYAHSIDEDPPGNQPLILAKEPRQGRRYEKGNNLIQGKEGYRTLVGTSPK
jgi:hypothetical protein